MQYFVDTRQNQQNHYPPNSILFSKALKCVKEVIYTSRFMTEPIGKPWITCLGVYPVLFYTHTRYSVTCMRFIFLFYQASPTLMPPVPREFLLSLTRVHILYFLLQSSLLSCLLRPVTGFPTILLMPSSYKVLTLLLMSSSYKVRTLLLMSSS